MCTVQPTAVHWYKRLTEVLPSSNGMPNFSCEWQCSTHKTTGKGKTNPIRPRQAPRAQGGWGFLDFRQSACEGGKVDSSTHQQTLCSREIPNTHFCKRFSCPRDIERLGQRKTLKHLIENRIHNILACSRVPHIPECYINVSSTVTNWMYTLKSHSHLYG